MLVLREMGSTTTYGLTVRERFGMGVAAVAAGVNVAAGGGSDSLRSRFGREVAGIMRYESEEHCGICRHKTPE